MFNVPEGRNCDIQGHSNSSTTAPNSRRSGVSTPSVPSHGVNQPRHQPGNTFNHALGATSSPNPTIGSTDEPSTSGFRNDPVLFLSVNVNSNQTIARAVRPGKDDKTTFKELQKEYRKLCSRWFRVKHITGIRFYRVSTI